MTWVLVADHYIVANALEERGELTYEDVLAVIDAKVDVDAR